MALDTQIHMYSVDTGHFYSNHELYLHNKNKLYRQERNYVTNKLSEIENALISNHNFTQEEINALRRKKINAIDSNKLIHAAEIIDNHQNWFGIIEHKRFKAKQSKNKLLNILSNKASTKASLSANSIRLLRENALLDTNIISVFESQLTRTIGIKADELTNALIVVQVYYFDVFKDILLNGFLFKGAKYKYLTSSAGQIRKKKAVFIKENDWVCIEKAIMCGLTVEKINNKGGNNVNKHLAYLALSNSATDEWKDFDINKSIVIEDFETDVFGVFDFIDETDYSITRKENYVPITHTDGAGMILPSLMKKNTMFRAPWVKGLLGVFDFRRFIDEHHCSPIIKDIYGCDHDIIKEDIQIIFTKSQFKMYKYYDSWDEYKTYFKKYNCSAGLCNIEEDRIKNAKINYQMLQTLTEITCDEIDILAQPSAKKITDLCTSEEAMRNVLGVTPYNNNMSPFQKALKIYPALLNDTYTKDILREVKKSLLKKYRSGKLEVNGKYTFLLPDYYAACQYWFLNVKNPKGLLGNNEVFCWLFKNTAKLDCLRSPHLYKEHAIRLNSANEEYNAQCSLIRSWFTTNGIYTSSHDLISKILQFDVDGDKSLVVADRDFVSIAERNMYGIVPLYYNMRKAEPTELNSENIYNGLIAAFTGGNIGIYSNDISKIWNSEVFITGDEKTKKEAIDVIKLLCCENNFVIDYAKTLYKPTRPEYIKQLVSKYTKCKLPAFFEFAKDKSKSQVEKPNSSIVNSLYNIIPNKPINTRGLQLGHIDHYKLMGNRSVRCSKEVSDLYNNLNKQYRYMINMKDEYIDNLHYVADSIRKEFNVLGYSDSIIADMLVQYLYGNERRAKHLLWFCFGQYILTNLETNLRPPKTKYIQCSECGEWFEVLLKDGRAKKCAPCYQAYRKLYKAQNQRIHRLQRDKSNS